jgi:hypothetical protein
MPDRLCGFVICTKVRNGFAQREDDCALVSPAEEVVD